MDPTSSVLSSALLVDGDATSRRVLAAMLDDIGYTRIRQAENIASALKCFDESRFDLALIDLGFAEKEEGCNLISLLRSRSGANARIIAITATDHHDLREAALQRGADIVFGRPPDWDKLVAGCIVKPSRPSRED